MPKSQSPAFFAILSDVHANIDALQAVLEDMELWPVRSVFCLGDIIGYGPEPAACVEKMAELCAVTVIGNHEAMLLCTDEFEPGELDPTIGKPLTLAAAKLSAAQMEWIKDLPISADLNPITLSHAALNDPGHFGYIQNRYEARLHFEEQKTFVSFQGHTHQQTIWQENENGIAEIEVSEGVVPLDKGHRYAINVGSVGQPRDRDPRAGYVLYDFQRRILVHRRVEYDIARAQARFKKAKLPARNAERLSKGR